MRAIKSTFDVYKLKFEDIYSDSKPASLNLAQFHDHPQWEKLSGITMVYLTNQVNENFISVMQFPKGTIKQTSTAASKTYMAGMFVSSEDILVDAINHYYTELPNDKEFVFNYTQLGFEVIWSNAVIISEKTAAKEYEIPQFLQSALFINKKGVRIKGYRKNELKPRTQTLKLAISNPKNYSREGIAMLLAWEAESKNIHTVASICPKEGILLKTIMATSLVVKPTTHDDLFGVCTYTTLPLDAFICSDEFWEKLFELSPDLLTLFGALTDETRRNEVFSIYALKLLSKN